MKKRLYEDQVQYSKEERNAFMESVRQFNKFKDAIYSSGRLKEMMSEIDQVVELAETFTLNETGNDYFDNITVSRDMKRLKESHKVFQKTYTEIAKLQQRLESSYEDMGMVFNRYYDID